jgi:hypothetical protein
MKLSVVFLVLNQLKVDHWQTKKHSEHIALGEAYEALDVLSDANYNIAIGYQSGNSLSSGSNNIILGATGGTAGMENTFAYYNNANNYLTINSGAIVTATTTDSNRYIPIVIGGTTYKLLLST